MSAIQNKDHLLGLLNNAEGLSFKMEAIETIITVLTHTRGFWQELSYSYKAAEIARRCINDLDYFLRDDNLHWKRRRAVENKVATLLTLERQYLSAQENRYWGESNLELAS